MIRMHRQVSTWTWYIAALIIFFTILLATATSLAIPTLQINIPSGQYVDYMPGSPFNEGMLIVSDAPFSLQAFYAPENKKSSTLSSWDFYLSCALMNLDGTKVSSLPDPFAISINNLSYPSDSFSYGKPQGLPPHGVFDTYYIQIAFDFEPTDLTHQGIFNVQNPSEGGKPGYIHDFNINAQGLGKDYGLVFDLYAYNQNYNTILFAPFSHNAALISSYNTADLISHDQGDIVPLPDTLFLLAIGLMGIWGIRIGIKRKKDTSILKT